MQLEQTTHSVRPVSRTMPQSGASVRTSTLADTAQAIRIQMPNTQLKECSAINGIT